MRQQISQFGQRGFCMIKIVGAADEREGSARVPAVMYESQIHVALLHAPRLPYLAVIEAHKVRLLAGKPTGENLIRTQLRLDEIRECEKFVLQLIFSAEHINRGKHARRGSVTYMNDLIRFALAAKLCAVNFKACTVADRL